MYNIGPLDRLNRLFQQFSGEARYWFGRITRLISGGRGGSLPEMPDADVKGAPVLLIAVAGCLLILCCLCVVVLGGAVIYLVPLAR